MRFRALQDFISPELRSEYLAGLIYTVRPGNEILADAVPKWVAARVVELINDSVPQSRLTAKGTVS